MTASQFAELMEIQPSNVSHLLNGRNKPSLDFLIKLKEVFPEYSFDWIIMGKKPITMNEPNPVSNDSQDIKFEDDDKRVIEFDDIEENIPVMEHEIIEKDIENHEKTSCNHEIEKIMLVYTDKTFEIITPR
ncbi:MAG: helix-turn-helix transcriptional regulator [Bacteroidales bacterium]|nr:helix-turn-helix transcriptional regulator [Bacteroidales bacterium]